MKEGADHLLVNQHKVLADLTTQRHLFDFFFGKSFPIFSSVSFQICVTSRVVKVPADSAAADPFPMQEI